MKEISSGAEAIIYETDSGTILKKRVEKTYRHSQIDTELRKSRTNREAKVLKTLESISIPAPKLLKHDKKDFSLEMEKVQGKKLSISLEKLDYEKIAKQLGKTIAKMHEKDIIHGDLTTSNMIYNEDDKKVYLIDFGLSISSTKIEDKAVDLHLLRQALESKHHRIYEDFFKILKKGYGNKEVLDRLEIVEMRGRNKAKH